VFRAVRVFDGHNDVLSRLTDGGDPAAGFLAGDGAGHLDLPRAEAAGLGGGCFAIFTCHPPEESYDTGAYFAAAPLEQSRAEALAQAALLLRLERESGGRLRIARTAADLGGDGLAAVLHMEGAEPIGPGLDELEVLYAAGLRSLGLVWSRPNAFATGVPFGFPGSPDQGPGLTDRGRALVRACCELGILVDVSHLNERGFWDVAGMLDGPLVASHSAAHALCPSPRNLTDEQLRAVGASGGIVGINFHVGFLRADGEEDADTPLERIAEHAAYVAGIAGPEAVALGSDFDGATMPAPLGDVTGLPALLDALRTVGGFGEEELAGVAHGNWHRVLAAAWAT
jgi:membrane dipeptidase